MKQTILLLVLSVGLAFNSFAQSPGNKFNVGFYGAQPLNFMNSLFDGGVGGSVKYEYRLKTIKEPLYFTIESGYESFFVKAPLQNAFVPSSVNYIPIKFGVKYYVLTGLYAELQAGVVEYAQHGGGNAFDFSPGIGYSFKQGFEIGLRYEEWNQTPEKHITGDYGISGTFKNPGNFGQMALRIAERF